MGSRGWRSSPRFHMCEISNTAAVWYRYGIFPSDIIEEFTRKPALVHDARPRFISSVELRICSLEERQTPRHDRQSARKRSRRSQRDFEQMIEHQSRYRGRKLGDFCRSTKKARTSVRNSASKHQDGVETVDPRRVSQQMLSRCRKRLLAHSAMVQVLHVPTCLIWSRSRNYDLQNGSTNALLSTASPQSG